MRLRGEPPTYCDKCEEYFTESQCPTCGYEYEPPEDYAEKMHLTAARSREYQRSQLRNHNRKETTNG